VTTVSAIPQFLGICILTMHPLDLHILDDDPLSFMNSTGKVTVIYELLMEFMPANSQTISFAIRQTALSMTPELLWIQRRAFNFQHTCKSSAFPGYDASIMTCIAKAFPKTKQLVQAQYPEPRSLTAACFNFPYLSIQASECLL